MSNNHDLDDKRISRLYRKGSTAEPPKHLDEKIIQAAHAAAPVSKRRFVWPRLATAAVLVLSISLVLKVLDQESQERALLESTPQERSLEIPAPPALEKEVTAEESAPAPATLMQDREAPKATTPERKANARVEMFMAAPEKPADAPVTPKQDTVGAAGVIQLPAARNRARARPESVKKRELPKLQIRQKAMSPVPSGRPIMLDCSGVSLPETDSVEEWIKAYKAALDQGQTKKTKCLKQEFFNRFGKTLPDS